MTTEKERTTETARDGTPDAGSPHGGRDGGVLGGWLKAVGAFALAFALAGAAGAAPPDSARAKPRKDRVVIMAAHPDDLISCAGLVLLTKDVFEWHLVDFTYGEWGLGKKGFEDGSTKATRIREEEAACALAGIRLHWLGGCDGSLYANEEMCEKLRRLVCEIDPRAIITHWPIDCNADHVMCGAMTLKVLRSMGKMFDESLEVYFHDEVGQPRNFTPHHWVDISPVLKQRDELRRCYACQNPEGNIALFTRSNDLRGFWSRVGGFRGRYYEVYADLGCVTAGRRTIFDEIPQR